MAGKEGAYFAPRGFAAQQQSNIRPEFEVHPIPGERTREIRRYEKVKDEDTGKFHFILRKEKVTEPAGFMVYFARGHSIRVRDEEELARLELHRQPGLVDLDKLEMLPGQQVPSLASLDQARAMMRTRPPVIDEGDLASLNVGDDEVNDDADD